jgi:hypothetical protein
MRRKIGVTGGESGIGLLLPFAIHPARSQGAEGTAARAPDRPDGRALLQRRKPAQSLKYLTAIKRAPRP